MKVLVGVEIEQLSPFPIARLTWKIGSIEIIEVPAAATPIAGEERLGGGALHLLESKHFPDIGAVVDFAEGHGLRLIWSPA